MADNILLFVENRYEQVFGSSMFVDGFRPAVPFGCYSLLSYSGKHARSDWTISTTGQEQ